MHTHTSVLANVRSIKVLAYICMEHYWVKTRTVDYVLGVDTLMYT